MADRSSKLAHWRAQFDAWQNSGLTRAAWCAREGISLSTFDHWRREVRRAEPRSQRKGTALQLVPVRVAAARTDDAMMAQALTLRSPTGWQIELPASFDPVRLAAILRALA